jgi:hypothetical protein
MTVTRDSDIQALSGWQRHMGTDGDVAATAPKLSTMTLVSGAAEFLIQGAVDPTKVAGVDYYLARPIPPGASRLCMRYVLEVNSDHTANCNSDENDCIFTDQSEYSYNGSVQNNNAEGGMLQVSNPSAGWVDTGEVIGKYAPDVEHELLVLYEFDFTKRTLTTVGFVFDDAFFPVPANVATVPGASKGWTDKMQVIVQLQQMLTVAAGAQNKSYVITYKHVDLCWS